ncbi:Uu.00g034890.m01.CDS01 [Anthostomella pinea]|uniref:Non-homologous end-joining factor 1 n=1 Tax=Anthostomella pinea TaxID=933095 RepID=A0AAI8VA59_9PEZI|nr:Uu.00g034890.m01.CDS01 [Anthostomella pinea]
MVPPATRWLPLPAFPDLPTLLISPRFASSSYTLHMTDLANIWVESLDRRAILWRSLEENTSIDLSDADPAQWAVFLSKLGAALDPASPDHHLTSLSLRASPTPDSEGGLTLHITCVLPKPLKPLKWPVYLTKCQPASLASELVLPLVQGHHAQNREAEDLMGRLREKDAIITKLVDKLEASHIGLEQVFNAFSGRHSVTRAAAEAKVKGLAPFHEDDWRAQQSVSQTDPQDVTTLIQSVFGNAGLERDTDLGVGASDQLNDWWTKLGSNNNEAVKPRKTQEPTGIQESPPTHSKPSAARDDDDFQVQATPPHLQSRHFTRNDPNQIASDGDMTDDDSSEVVPDSHPAPSQEKPRSLIGALGGTKKVTQDHSASQSSRTLPTEEDETASESDDEPIKPTYRKQPSTLLGTISKHKKPSPSPAKASSPAPPPPHDGDDTATGSDSDSNNSAHPRPSAKPASTPQRRGGLGRIGGGSKTPTATPEKRKDTPSDTEIGNAAGSAKPPARRIGAIRHRPQADAKRPRPESPVDPEEPETEEQKAERKRAELAKELERKAAAPAKKKRRF